MTKQAIIEHTIEVINQLSEEKAVEIAEFADSLITPKNELALLQKQLRHLQEGLLYDVDVQNLASSLEARLNQFKDELILDRDVQSLATGKSFDFLKNEEDIYTLDDLKEVYGKG